MEILFILDATAMWIIGLAISGAVSTIGVYVQMSTRQALDRQKADYNERRISDLEKRMKDHEDKLTEKVLEIHEMVNNIQLLIAKYLPK